MKAIDYGAIAVKELGRQRVRSFLTIMALAISTVILVTMAAISLGGRKAITQLGPDQALTTIVVTPNQSAGNLSPFGSIQVVNNKASKLDDATVAQLGTLPHVHSAVPEAYVWEFSSFTIVGGAKQFVAQAEGVPSNISLPLVAGSGFAPNDSHHDIILGYAYAQELGYGGNAAALIGKNISITTQKGYRGDGAAIPGPTASAQVNDQFNQVQTTLSATIVGVTKAGDQQNQLFLPMDWARSVRTLRYWSGDSLKTTDQIAQDGYTSILVNSDTPASVKTVAAAIDHLGYGEISTLAQIQRLEQFSTIMWVILGSVAIVATIVATLGVVNTMLMAVSEQRYTIGVWRACGARKRLIVRLFLVEAAILGFVGGACGTGLGVVVSRFTNDRVNVLLRTQNLPLANVAITPLWLLGGAVLLTSIFGILAGLYPAYRASRQDPSEILTGGV